MHARAGAPPAARCATLRKACPALWTFTKHPGIEPTNNHAEPQLRSAVNYRKLSL
jgi:transposase